MGLLETLVLGSYVWSAMLAGWFHRQLDRIKSNHFAHLAEDVQQLRAEVAELKKLARPEV